MTDGTMPLPRELVLASAGTGKTFRISSRIIGLLAAGARPEDVFASTFTRKAAGEILDRVLARLATAALDDGEARALAEFARLGEEFPPSGRGSDDWLTLLQTLVRELHRFNVGTLDSFFVRTASSFAEEAGLPPAWRIGDEPSAAVLRSAALGDVLADADRAEIAELVRGAAGGAARRSVHDRLLDELGTLLELLLAVDPAVADPWSGFDDVVGPRTSDLADRQARIAARIRAAEPPLTRAGTPRASWVRALEAAARAVEAGDWEGLVCQTLCERARAPGGEFDRVPVPDAVCDALEEARDLARGEIARRLARRGRTLGELARRFAEALGRRRRERGLYGFADLTRLLGGDDPLCGRPDLHYRLDARIRHLLLDEFQDTSLAQWEALHPLVDELLSGHIDERAATIVADPKQSIYGWRGGEPLLVRRVGEWYALTGEVLARSWRSSPTVLHFVNTVFEDLGANGVFSGDAAGVAVATDWSRDFAPHIAAKDLPGHVVVEVGPEDEGRGSDRPRLCRRAAERIAELRRAHPGRSIGVLTRTNRAVARLIFELRALDVPASEEGGNPLTDSAAVATVLALLRLADHPGDRIARYHVAKTPLGAAVGLVDHDDDRAARRLGERLRAELVEDGYGRTLARIAERVRDRCDAREARRLDQLVELGFRYDAGATLRVTDFVALVESERVEAPTEAEVRVMTVHQSKGLEFDIVVLPELESSLVRSATGPLAYRPDPTGRITHLFPYVKEGIRSQFEEVPELRGAAEQTAAAGLRDALSGVYVALTRARHALHLLLAPDGKNGIGTSCSAANLVRHALGATEPAREGDVLYQAGDPAWSARLDRPRAAATPAATAGPSAIRLAPPTGRRTLARVTPSGLAGDGAASLAGVLRIDTAAADAGTLVHAWMETVAWIEDGGPDDAVLGRIARRTAPHLAGERLDELLDRFRGWLAAPAIRMALSRAGYPPGSTVHREVPFVVGEGDGLLEGFIDRLVLVPAATGAPARAEVLDFKTDRIEPGDVESLDARTAGYRPQLDAYRRGVHAAFGIPPEHVAARLLFLHAGAVRDA
jgi:ATP-dependent helicase/nuclease subunit A